MRSAALRRDETSARTGHLVPGEILAPREPMRLTTILGSCVALCLFDGARGIGGMNHFVLPDAPAGDRTSCRFASVACARLLDALDHAGSSRRDLTAKLFGGACVVDALRTDRHLGERNVDAALVFLDREGIPLVAIDVGGRHGRKLTFATDSGAAWVRTIARGDAGGHGGR